MATILTAQEIAERWQIIENTKYNQADLDLKIKMSMLEQMERHTAILCLISDALRVLAIKHGSD